MRKELLDGERIFVVHDLLTIEECAALQLRGEDMAFARGADAARDCERVAFDDPALASRLYRRVRPFLPATVAGQALVGFHERWWFYRYGRGQTYAPHRDAAHVRERERQESRLTLMVYLSDDVVGGATRFFVGMDDAFAGRAWLTVAPSSGTALIFEHRLWHEGAAVEQGRKVVLRTDVMYGPPPR